MSITEGKVTLNTDTAFYNETQVFNRDFSVLAISTFFSSPQPSKPPPLTLLDALSASGLRALRYAAEVPHPLKITANDISEAAVRQIAENAALNGKTVEISHSDANLAMRRRTFGCIDIDPYGAPTPFLEAAIASAAHGALLCVTSTDGLATCGRQPDECLRRYQALPGNSVFGHEASVRIVVQAIASAAARQRCGIDVLCSFYQFHYLRVFVRVDKKHSRAVEMLQNLVEVSYCNQCQKSQVSRRIGMIQQEINCSTHCSNCQGQLKVCGPIWGGKLADKDFLDSLMAESVKFEYLNQIDRIRAFIQFQMLDFDKSVLFYDLASLCKCYKLTCPPQTIFSNFCRQNGAEIVPTVFAANGFKCGNYEKMLQVLNLWFRVMNKAVKKEKVWIGKEDEKLYLKSQEDLMVIIKSQCGFSDEELEAFVGDSDNLKEFVDEKVGLVVDKEFKGEWLVSNKLGLFKANPGKNWGPKKMK